LQAEKAAAVVAAVVPLEAVSEVANRSRAKRMLRWRIGCPCALLDNLQQHQKIPTTGERIGARSTTRVMTTMRMMETATPGDRRGKERVEKERQRRSVGTKAKAKAKAVEEVSGGAHPSPLQSMFGSGETQVIVRVVSTIHSFADLVYDYKAGTIKI